jgi:hypothetical protein
VTPEEAACRGGLISASSRFNGPTEKEGRIIPRTKSARPQPSRHVRWKGAAPLSGEEEQTARAISAHALCVRLLSLQMGSIN